MGLSDLILHRADFYSECRVASNDSLFLPWMLRAEDIFLGTAFYMEAPLYLPDGAIAFPRDNDYSMVFRDGSWVVTPNRIMGSYQERIEDQRRKFIGVLDERPVGTYQVTMRLACTVSFLTAMLVPNREDWPREGFRRGDEFYEMGLEILTAHPLAGELGQGRRKVWDVLTRYGYCMGDDAVRRLFRVTSDPMERSDWHNLLRAWYDPVAYPNRYEKKRPQ